MRGIWWKICTWHLGDWFQMPNRPFCRVRLRFWLMLMIVNNMRIIGHLSKPKIVFTDVCMAAGCGGTEVLEAELMCGASVYSFACHSRLSRLGGLSSWLLWRWGSLEGALCTLVLGCVSTVHWCLLFIFWPFIFLCAPPSQGRRQVQVNRYAS